MRVGPVQGILGSLIALGLVLGVGLGAASCGGQNVGGTALPTFTASATEAKPGPAADEGAIPNDCERLLSSKDLNALLGLPLDTVTVKSTLGVAEPSVGRTERLACRYTTRGAAADRRPLLDMNAASYTSADLALQQWRRNSAIEDGEHRQLPIGSLGAVVVERGNESLLSVVYGLNTLTVVLPDQPLPGGRPRAEVLVDLALRTLPSIAPVPAPAPPPAPAGLTKAPSSAGQKTARPSSVRPTSTTDSANPRTAGT